MDGRPPAGPELRDNRGLEHFRTENGGNAQEEGQMTDSKHRYGVSA
jgi:hypothetical protein